jgi:hypothetical protein
VLSSASVASRIRPTSAVGIVLAITLASTAACSGGGSSRPSQPPSTPGTPSPSPSSTALTYTNEGAGFSIEYPSDWEANESIPGTIVLFRAPLESASDPVRESVGVSTERLPSGYTLQDFIDAGLSRLEQDIPEFHLTSSESTTLAGHPAHRLVYTGKQEAITLQWLQVFTLVGQTGYVLTFVASPDSYATYEPTALDMFDSFALV